jgi:hypothetical protein
MIYGIEQSTDLRCSRTVIKKFTSEKAATAWAARAPGFTYTSPEIANNYHHTLRRIYNYRGRINKKDLIFQRKDTPTYQKIDLDRLADYIKTYGEEVEK